MRWKLMVLFSYYITDFRRSLYTLNTLRILQCKYTYKNTGASIGKGR